MIEILLHGMKMNPLVSLHYYAPVCALINLLVLPFTAGLEPFYEIMRVGCVLPISTFFPARHILTAAVMMGFAAH